MLLLLSIGIAIYSGYMLWGFSKVYSEGDKNYEFLQDQIRTAEEPEKILVEQDLINDIDIEERRKIAVAIPALSIDFGALTEINNDAAAWLYSPDTPIDYPVMRADDYEWYLRHLPDGTYNANGALFLDYNSSPDFTGRLSIVYGHNMKSEKMFGSLAKYKQQSYFEAHPYLYLYTEAENYRIDLKYGCVIGAGDWVDRAFVFESNLKSLLQYASSKSTFTSGVSYTEQTRFVVLSTCSYEFDDARYIVIGVLQPEYAP